jgi:hypothetical protein
MLLWVNLHASFALGIMLIGLSVLVKQVQAKKFLIADWTIVALSIAATFINPYRERAWWEVWMQMSDNGLRWSIQEWFPAFFFFNVGFMFLLPVSALLIIRYRKKFSPVELVLYATLLLFGLSSARHLPFWLLIAIPLTTKAIEYFVLEIQNIPFAKKRFLVGYSAFFVVFACTFLFYTAISSRSHGQPSVYPEKANSDSRESSQNADNIYFVTDKAIFSIDKKSGKKSELIKNDKTWERAVAIAPFQANLYVLDSKNGILKFAASTDGFSKSDYLKQSADLNQGVSMAIDSAVWVLFSDGSIKKYLRGEAESFSIKNLGEPFTNPTKIASDADTENLYVLDPGNSRIVRLAKDGTFQNQYSASIIKSAKDFEVLEKYKKVHILSGDKIYQLDLD